MNNLGSRRGSGTSFVVTDRCERIGPSSPKISACVQCVRCWAASDPMPKANIKYVRVAMRMTVTSTASATNCDKSRARTVLVHLTAYTLMWAHFQLFVVISPYHSRTLPPPSHHASCRVAVDSLHLTHKGALINPRAPALCRFRHGGTATRPTLLRPAN